jgi:hypothetical protein
MDFDGRPDHIEDVLVSLHDGQWFGWSDSKNKVYANLVIHSADAKPTESELTTGLTNKQTSFDNAATARTNNKTSGRDKLVALGLSTDELDALGIS